MSIAIVMGSNTDYPLVQKAEEVLKEFNVEWETRVISAHRTPKAALHFAEAAEERGVDVIIAAAGKAAHLAGVMASSTPLPVIGLPIKASALDGLDALLSVVQMPKGVPVATVAIDGAENAALLAIQILAVKQPELREEMKKYKKEMERKIIAIDMDFQKGKDK